MAFYLNPYEGFLDTSEERGLKLYTDALDKFRSNLCGKIRLDPEFADAIASEISNLSLRYGYH